MSCPSFAIKEKYSPKDHDLLIFPFADDKTPLFSQDQVPIQIDKVFPSKEAGKAQTVFAGKIENSFVIARSVRLDEKDIGQTRCAKKALSSSLNLAQDEGLLRIVVFVRTDDQMLLSALHEGAILGGYRFDKYLSEKKNPVAVELVIGKRPDSKLKKLIEQDQLLFNWVNFARDILNEPPNEANPQSLSELFAKAGKKAGLKIQLWDEKRLAKERCGAILAVGKGASHAPRLVIGQYNPRKAKGHLAIIGKGITFDSGGYCLKPPKSQMGMKYDMGGAALAFAAACALAEMKIPLKITVLTPLAENIVSDRAYLTSDIITTRSGKTVQVDNTDAEGRLVLADALTIACEKRPDWMLDAATLTGACVVALGEDIAAIYGTDESLIELFRDAGRQVGEQFWPLPLYMPYMEQLKTTIADCKNIGSRWGGSITGALFLRQFVSDEIPWLHLDIAGPAVKEEPLEHLGKGAKGFGVKATVTFAQRLVSS